MLDYVDITAYRKKKEGADKITATSSQIVENEIKETVDFFLSA